MENFAERDSSIRRFQILHRPCRLPVFSQTALKLLTIASHADSGREDFVSAFRAEPSLAADLSIVANSGTRFSGAIGTRRRFRFGVVEAH
jgi:HD-like signal output (HDOD) protein